jgi:hypothetical protein
MSNIFYPAFPLSEQLHSLLLKISASSLPNFFLATFLNVLLTPLDKDAVRLFAVLSMLEECGYSVKSLFSFLRSSRDFDNSGFHDNPFDE